MTKNIRPQYVWTDGSNSIKGREVLVLSVDKENDQITVISTLFYLLKSTHREPQVLSESEFRAIFTTIGKRLNKWEFKSVNEQLKNKIRKEL